MKCKYCNYSKNYGKDFKHTGTYICLHPDIDKSEEEYEKKINKKIHKSSNIIGFHMIKTCLRWCPYNLSNKKSD